MCDHHDHSHNGCCHHGDEADAANSIAYSLFEKIDMPNVQCLNEKLDNTGIKVFKPWHERKTRDDFVESDCDAELIFNIPFTGDVKLKGLIVIGDQELYKLRLFKSNVRLSFDDVSRAPDQEIELAHDTEGTIEYPVKPTKFFNMHHLTMHFINRNPSDDDKPCKIYYIGLKGEFTPANRDGIVIANYEIRPTEGIPEELRKASREIQ